MKTPGKNLFVTVLSVYLMMPHRQNVVFCLRTLLYGPSLRPVISLLLKVQLSYFPVFFSLSHDIIQPLKVESTAFGRPKLCVCMFCLLLGFFLCVCVHMHTCMHVLLMVGGSMRFLSQSCMASPGHVQIRFIASSSFAPHLTMAIYSCFGRVIRLACKCCITMC